MDEPGSGVDRFISKIKNNPFVSVIAFLATLIIALSTFTNAAKNVLALVSSKAKRPPVNGTWKADITYDWENAKYTEIFVFEGEGEQVLGTASFLGIKRQIANGKTTKDKIEFITKTQEILGEEKPEVVVHRYQGSLVGNEISFVMHTEGGFSEHVDIKFVAKKVPGN